MENLKQDFWYEVGLDDMENRKMTFEEQQEFMKKDKYNPRRVNIDENLNAYRYDENRNKVYL